MGDEEMRIALTHLQKQINHLAVFTGQALGALTFHEPRERAALDHVVTAWEGLAGDDRSKLGIMHHVRRGADMMLSASRDHLPDDELPLGKEYPWSP